MKDLNTVWGTSDLIGAGLAYTVMGILIVFLILVIIMMVIKAMALFSGEKKAKNKQASLASNASKQEAVPVVQEAPKTDDCELVAVITAAIAAMTGESASGFVVRSYKKISGGAWNKAGRMEVLENKF